MRHLRGYGLLPDFSAGLERQYMAPLRTAISTAQQIQAQVAPLLTRPEGAQLVATIASAEAGMASSLSELHNAMAGLDAALQAKAAIQSSPEPQQSTYQFPNGHLYYLKAVEERTMKIATATQVEADKRAYANQIRDELAAMLANYNSKVPAAAKLVSDVVTTEIQLKTAETKAATATTSKEATKAETETFILEQKLAELERKAAEAAAAVAKKARGVSPVMLGAGALVLAVGGYLLLKKKRSPSVAGYRRRRRR